MAKIEMPRNIHMMVLIWTTLNCIWNVCSAISF